MDVLIILVIGVLVLLGVAYAISRASDHFDRKRRNGGGGGIGKDQGREHRH